MCILYYPEKIKHTCQTEKGKSEKSIQAMKGGEEKVKSENQAEKTFQKRQ